MYNVRTGIIALATNSLPSNSLLKKFDKTELAQSFEWNITHFKKFPKKIDLETSRIINGGLVELKPGEIKLSVKGLETEDRDGDGHVLATPGDVLTIEAHFFNNLGKLTKASGVVSWSHTRGHIRPKQGRVTRKTSAQTTLIVPDENISLCVRAILTGPDKFIPGALYIEVD